MRKTLVFTFVSLICCAFAFSQKKNASISISNNDGHNSVTINDDNVNFKLAYTGEISFSDDEKGFKTFPSDGFLRYQKNGTTLVVTVDAAGKIAYEFNGGDKKNVLNDEEKSILADAIRVMIDYGVGAKDRVARIYQKGGSEAVLAEVKNMQTDYVRGIYLEYLLATSSLTTAEMTEIADEVHSMIGSDYEKGRLLEEFSAKYLGNATTAKAFLEAVQSIHSDYEKAKAVKGILHQELTDQQFSAVIDITNSIGSDYEKGGVLKQVLEGNKLSSPRFTEVLNAVRKIQSDYEKAGVLKQMLSGDVVVPGEVFAETLDAVGSVGSDYEKAGVLKKLAASDINSDSHWVSLITATEKIGADYEKGETLRLIASRMPDSETIRNAYMKAARTISSDYEYGKTVRAVK